MLKSLDPGTLGDVSQFLASAAQHASSTHSGSHYTMLPLEIVLVVIGVVIGRLWGRRAGLKHLGETEFQARWSNVRKHRRW